MAINQLLNSFNAGEISPFLDARTDIEKYFSGCRVLENFIPTPYGPAMRRPGTVYLQNTKSGGTKSRLIPFVFSEEARYQIEVGDGYMRFWDAETGSVLAWGDVPAWVSGADYAKGDVVVESGDIYRCAVAHTSGTFATDLANGYWLLTGDPQEVDTSYSESDLPDIQFIQINNIAYFTHPGKFVYRVVRHVYNGSVYFTGANMIPDWPALLDEYVPLNPNQPISLQATGTTGDVIITRTGGAYEPEYPPSNFFNSSHSGAYFQISHQRTDASTPLVLTTNGTTSAVRVIGSWQLFTYGTWNGSLYVERSYDSGGTWTAIRAYGSAGDRNVAVAGNEITDCLLRLNYTGSGSAGANAVLQLDSAIYNGLVLITNVPSTTAPGNFNTADAIVVRDLYSSSATTLWTEGAWSLYRGFPRSIEAHENRIMYGGTAYKPQSVWGSQIDDYQNFRVGTLATDGLYFTIAENRVSQIQWMKSKDGFLHVGREGSEGRIYASDPASTLSPSDINWAHTTSYGSRHIPAVVLNDAMLFIQGQGRKIRSLAQIPTNSGYPSFSGADVTILSEHITKTGIIEFSAQNLPDAILWCIRDDGTLIGMSYDSLNSAIAWHRHTTQGFFESVSVIPGTYGDEVWFIVRREIDGETRRYVERFDLDWREKWEAENKSEWVYLDCSIRVVNSPANVIVNAGDHLEGEAVGCLSDGADASTSEEFVVTSATITLAVAGEINIVGLPYDSILRPMKLVMQTGNGPSRARTARISNIKIQLLKSLGMDISTDGTDYSDSLFRSDQDPLDQSPPPQSGLFDWTAPGDYNQDGGDFWIRQTHPMPLCVVATTPIWETGSN